MYALKDNLSKKVTNIAVRDLIMESIRRTAAQGDKSRPVWRVESLNNEKPDNEKGKDYDVVGLVRTGKHRVCGARR